MYYTLDCCNCKHSKDIHYSNFCKRTLRVLWTLNGKWCSTYTTLLNVHTRTLEICLYDTFQVYIYRILGIWRSFLGYHIYFQWIVFLSYRQINYSKHLTNDNYAFAWLLMTEKECIPYQRTNWKLISLAFEY